jgi:hypothetical protein
MKLTQQQRSFYETFGFISFPGLFKTEIGAISAEFDRIWERNCRDHDEKLRSRIIPFADQSEALSGLLDDPRIDELVASVLGPDYNYMGSDGNFYVGETNWHSDLFDCREHFFKIAFYLEPLDAGNGCLRVIPGSHRTGEPFANVLDQQLCHQPELLGIHGSQIPYVALDTRPGDVVCFDQRIKHSSYNGGTRRRMFSLNFSQRWTPERLPALRKYLLWFAQLGLDCPIGETMVRTAGPNRMTHLEQVLENSMHLVEPAAQARLCLAGPDRG